MNEAMRLEYFCRVVVEPIYEKMKELEEVHDLWVEEALLEAYKYEKPKGQGRHEFDQWVSLTKTHESVVHAFIEFECHFVQLSEWDQGLVGLDKVLLFVKLIDRKERKSIGIQLDDDDGANGLTEDWDEVKRICQQHDERKVGILSTMSRPMRDDRRMRCVNMPTIEGRKFEERRFNDTRHRNIYERRIQELKGASPG